MGLSMDEPQLTPEQQVVFDKTMAALTEGQKRISNLIPDKLLVFIDAGNAISIEQLADMMLAAWADGYSFSGAEK
jgi:hypothetical protein